METQLVTRQTPRRTYRSYFTDSTRWERYEPRPGDIVISTAPKVGTTWTQRIVSVLVFQSTRLPAPLMEVSPWLDCAFLPFDDILRALDEQRHRRFIKTHLPLDALPFHPEVSYLVVGRDPGDAALSAHNHALGMSRKADLLPPGATGEDVHTPVMPAIPEDIREHWRRYFTRSAFPWETNGWPFNSPTHHLASWWEQRAASNVLFLHYQDMLDDLDREMRRVSAFLGVEVDESRWPELRGACGFADMRAKRDNVFSPGAIANAVAGFDFFHRARSRQWPAEIDTPEDRALHDAAMRPLPADLRAWLARTE